VSAAAGDLWPWLALAGLGAYHGINPGMGWLFAVALGLHRGSRRVVLLSLIPIALGHALSIAVVAALVIALGVVLHVHWIQAIGGVVLIGWAIWHHLYGHRHRVRFGMKVGLAGLGAWSFLMASAHGAGLMLVPVLIPLGLGSMHGAHAHEPVAAGAAVALAAIGVHTAAMLATTAAIAIVVYGWVGVAILRRGWFNLDRLWTVALVATGLILLLAAGHGA
jgi:hypothetical protein